MMINDFKLIKLHRQRARTEDIITTKELISVYIMIDGQIVDSSPCGTYGLESKWMAF